MPRLERCRPFQGQGRGFFLFVPPTFFLYTDSNLQFTGPAVIISFMQGRKILIIEDEEDLVDLLRFNLEAQGYEVAAAYTGEEGLAMAQQEKPDVLLLDIMLPGMDGLDVCRRLKRSPATADISIIMVTAKGEESDIVEGLELGADDYVTKPFSLKVLFARIQAVLRRREGDDSPERLIRGPVMVDPVKFEVTVSGRPVTLTPTEFRILHLLVRKPGWTFTRNQIMQHVHGENHAATARSVDVQIVGLRRKLGEAGALIETIRGIGYRFRAAEDE